MCRWTPTYWHMRVEIFVEVAALNILMPLALALDGDTTVFPTVTVVGFNPKVGRLIDRHWCAMLRRWVDIWLH
jgi:hypothetical protein